MFQALTFLHNFTRWLVLASLLFAVYRAYRGYVSNSEFSISDNAVRHWTATIAHLQLVIGMILYFQSPIISYFWAHFGVARKAMDLAFFGLAHSTFMLTAIVLITLGSALTKRKHADSDKFKTMLVWFSIALLIIFITIPWPFSPFASRPYFR